MAGVSSLSSFAAPFISPVSGAIQRARASEISASRVVAVASRPALIPATLAPAPTISTIFITPTVATLAAQTNVTAPRAGASAAASTPPVLNQPPQVIIETNFITYTTIQTLPPATVTVTRTQPPPPPPPVRQPLHPPHPPLLPPPPTVSEGPNAGPLIKPQRPPPPPSATTFISQAQPSPILDPAMSKPIPGRGGIPPPNVNTQAQAGSPGVGPPTERGPRDLASGAFQGGAPTKSLDLPVTAMFMLLFMLGAYIHIRIYKSNAKRGHKFLISDIIFDFCMVRTVTCVFRIVWSIVATRGVILVALVTVNSGAALLFAVNIFFAQRLVRSIHPKAGWSTAFGQLTLLLLFSVPAFIIFNATSLIVSFFSVGNLDRLETTDHLLKFGAAFNMFLAAFPVIVVTGCLCVPGREAEKFGTGSLRVKVALLFFGSFLMMIGHAVRFYALVNKEPPGTSSEIFSKAVFYTTGFTLEILIVAAYAFGRVDLRFHVTNGSSGPGDYSNDRNRGNYSVEEIENLVDNLPVPHQIMRERKGPEDMLMVFVIFFATKKTQTEEEEMDGEQNRSMDDAAVVGSNAGKEGGRLGKAPLPGRPRPVSRRQTLVDALMSRPTRPIRETTATYPNIMDLYLQTDDESSPQRPPRPSAYSNLETRRGGAQLQAICAGLEILAYLDFVQE